MKCPNPKCSCKKFLPADANFCPECGTKLRPEKTDMPCPSYVEPITKSPNTIIQNFDITYCTAFPSTIKHGNRAILKWAGNDVKYIKIDGEDYSPKENIYFTPTSSKEYKVYFVSHSGKVCCKYVQVLVEKPEKISRIIFKKEELSRINAYDSGYRGLELNLNGKCIAYTEMRSYCQKEIVVKKGDVVKLVADPDSGTIMFNKTLFEIRITDDILSKSEYYLEYVKKMWVVGEVEFRATSYAHEQ